MREIKFRAWNGERVLLDWYECDEWLINESFSKTEYQIMQYTGLKDKDGVEIYEGDISESYGKKYKAIFEEGCFCWASEEIGANNNLPYTKISKFDCHIGPFKVIGNIYENPELLEP